MMILNVKKFSELLQEKPEFKVAEEIEEIDRDRNNFFSVVCGKSKLAQCEELGYEDLLTMMENADTYINCEDNFSLQKSKMIDQVDNSMRYMRRRIL